MTSAGCSGASCGEGDVLLPTDRETYAVYLEIGTKRVFAGAIEWPGWCRAGRDQESALEALVASGPRYSGVVAFSGLDLQGPAEIGGLRVVERLQGNSTTDFGAPAVPPSADGEPIDEDQHQRFVAILRAGWRAFDQAVDLAEGKELRKGPRGGGRELEAITHHVLQADRSYLGRIGRRAPKLVGGSMRDDLQRMRDAVLDGFQVACGGGLPKVGPRGGKRWTPRYLVRRVAWHVIDHAWEIEDRMAG